MKFNILNKIYILFGYTYKSCESTELELENSDTTNENKEFERCIMCGQLTNIHISVPIELRENYVSGCGQLCNECAKKSQTILN